MPKWNKEDYLHHNDRVITPRDYSDALMVQSACNLCGIAQSFAAVVKRINQENEGSEWAHSHPVVVLYLAQIMWLSIGESMSHEVGITYFDAHAVCEARAEVAVSV